MPRGGTGDAGGCWWWVPGACQAGELPCSRNAPRREDLPACPPTAHLIFKGKEKEPLTTSENKLLSASSAQPRTRLAQHLCGVRQALPRQIITRMVLFPLGGWKGWGGVWGDLLGCCGEQGDDSRVSTRRRLGQEGVGFLESQVGAGHRLLVRAFCLANIWQLP